MSLKWYNIENVSSGGLICKQKKFIFMYLTQCQIGSMDI